MRNGAGGLPDRAGREKAGGARQSASGGREAGGEEDEWAGGKEPTRLTKRQMSWRETKVKGARQDSASRQGITGRNGEKWNEEKEDA